MAVQEFEEYSRRDYGRPVRDTKSGTLPPKLAQMMINLAQAPKGSVILDPFCGSGTVLQEALLLGYQVIGSDQSEKAVADTKKNLEWFIESQKSNLKSQNYNSEVKNFKVFLTDVRQLGQQINQVDAIVTEPYLGPALRGQESLSEIKSIVAELEKLYLDAFGVFEKILKPGGKVVIVLPYFTKHNLKPEIQTALGQLGFERLNQEDLIYSRPDQKVWREIVVWGF